MLEYGNGATFAPYAAGMPTTIRSEEKRIRPSVAKATLAESAAAHDTPSGRRVFMHDVIMGLDTLEDE